MTMEWKSIDDATPRLEWLLCFADDWECPCVLMLGGTHGYPDEWNNASGDGGQDYRPIYWTRWDKPSYSPADVNDSLRVMMGRLRQSDAEPPAGAY